MTHTRTIAPIALALAALLVLSACSSTTKPAPADATLPPPAAEDGMATE